MGILDDAIREHLDLKRRRGADPNEIERLEREALGPVRRGNSEPHDAPETELAESPGYPTAGVEETWSGSGEEPATGEHGGEPADEPPDWETSEHESLPGVGVEPEAAPAVPPFRAHEEPGSAGQLVPEDAYLDQDTVEHDVEREQSDQQRREDMLEETPEFLQDTPEHDRLWFEQRPPRDFDLDG